MKANLIVALIFIAAIGLSLRGQQEVKLSPQPADRPLTTIYHYTSGNNDYICKAFSTQDISTITVSAISNANTGVLTATGHGFYYSATATQKIVAFISGLTGNWTPLNGLHVLTPTSANALSTDVDTTTFGPVTGTGVFSTRAPKATASVWAVQVFGYDASNNQILSSWITRTTALSPATTTTADLSGGTSAFAFPCAAPGAYE